MSGSNGGRSTLTFADPNDYGRIRASDRLSLLGLQQLAAGQPVKCRLAHADGTEETLQLRHSYSERQLEWFRAGSALNTIAEVRARSVRRG